MVISLNILKFVAPEILCFLVGGALGHEVQGLKVVQLVLDGGLCLHSFLLSFEIRGCVRSSFTGLGKPKETVRFL